MDDQSPTAVAQSTVRYAQDQFSDVMAQTEEFVREKPAQALAYAALAGFVLNRLPLGRIFGAFFRLFFIALKPALLIYGARKVYESMQHESAR